jgi:hypothetical protein
MSTVAHNIQHTTSQHTAEHTSHSAYTFSTLQTKDLGFDSAAMCPCVPDGLVKLLLSLAAVDYFPGFQKDPRPPLVRCIKGIVVACQDEQQTEPGGVTF